MKVTHKLFKQCLELSAGLLAGILVAGCGSVKYSDPVNPSSPYAFPGQTPTAAQYPPTASPTPPGVMPVPSQYLGGPVAVPPRIPSDDALTSSSVLRAGDTIIISFGDIPQPIAPITTELGADGKITLPFNIIVQAIGKTTRQLEQEIRSEYVPKYYNYLTVTVKTEMRFFHVGGEVKVPSALPYRSATTVLRAIGAAGGFTDFAKRSRILLTRSNGEKHTIDSEKALKDPVKDLAVYPGDYIYVPKRRF